MCEANLIIHMQKETQWQVRGTHNTKSHAHRIYNIRTCERGEPNQTREGGTFTSSSCKDYYFIETNLLPQNFHISILISRVVTFTNVQIWIHNKWNMLYHYVPVFLWFIKEDLDVNKECYTSSFCSVKHSKNLVVKLTPCMGFDP